MKLLERFFGKRHDDEDDYLIGREARRRAARRAGVLPGSRAHVSRMAHRRKSPPELATHLYYPTETTTIRMIHPDYFLKKRAREEEEARANAVSDAGKGRGR